MASLKATLEKVGSGPIVIRTLNQDPVASCPHCQSEAIQKFGWANNLERYRCKACRTTFNRLTGTPLARLRKKEKWLGALKSLNEKETLTQMQKSLKISRPTAHLWRKRFLSGLQPSKSPILNGIVEADETFVRRGQKGTKCMDRAPRRRGEPAEPGGTKQKDWVCVLTARDRNKQTVHELPDNQRTEVFETFLTPLIAPDSVLCSDGLSGYEKFSTKHGIHHVVLRSKHREFLKGGVYHIQNVNSLHMRFQEMFSHFRGVAAKYMGHYLGWLDHLDRLSNNENLEDPLVLLKNYTLNS